MSVDKNLLKLRYDQLLTLWQSFCERHNNLYKLTCDEYGHLLVSDIDELEKTLEKKDLVIDAIRDLEKVRKELIIDINKEKLFANPIVSISTLLNQMQTFESTLNLIGLEKYNDLLISIIENIQDQNKKNQTFLNKAISSIEDLKQKFTNHKTYQTYDSKGLTKKNQISAR